MTPSNVSIEATKVADLAFQLGWIRGRVGGIVGLLSYY